MNNWLEIVAVPIESGIAVTLIDVSDKKAPKRSFCRPMRR
jgi:uncharacterized lipoprotein YbaY